MKMFLLVLAIPFVLLMGCGPQITTERYQLRSYKINSVQQANVGSQILSFSDINIKRVTSKTWVGFLFAPDGWKIDESVTDNSMKEQLIYTGRSGDTINVSYREYIKNMARPAFFHDLKYDLSESDVIVFRRWRIRVLEANNEFMRFTVLEE